MDLFDHGARNDPAATPLADRMRPRRLEDVVGQKQLLAEGKLLQQAIVADRTPR